EGVFSNNLQLSSGQVLHEFPGCHRRALWATPHPSREPVANDGLIFVDYLQIGKVGDLSADSSIDDHATKGRQALQALFRLPAPDHLQDDVRSPTTSCLLHPLNPVLLPVIDGDIASQAAHQIEFVLGPSRTNHGACPHQLGKLKGQGPYTSCCCIHQHALSSLKTSHFPQQLVSHNPLHRKGGRMHKIQSGGTGNNQSSLGDGIFSIAPLDAGNHTSPLLWGAYSWTKCHYRPGDLHA